jgi:hypothetical protein
MPVCRIKNKFAQDDTSALTEGAAGYRDLKVFVLMEGFGGLRIIGEIQVEAHFCRSILVNQLLVKQNSIRTSKMTLLVF